MKFLQEAFSSLINLVFASNDPKENERLRSWWEIIGLFLLFGSMLFVMAQSGGI